MMYRGVFTIVRVFTIVLQTYSTWLKPPHWQVKDFTNDPSYHEQLSKKEAEKKLKEQGGSVKCYLTRYSDTSKAHKLSVMHGRGKNQFEHFEISRAKYALIDNDMCFKTLSEMLEYYRKHRISNTLRNIGVPVVYSKYTASKDGEYHECIAYIH